MVLESACLVGKHEDSSWVTRTHVIKPDMMACAYNPSTGEVETGAVLGLTGQPF